MSDSYEDGIGDLKRGLAMMVNTFILIDIIREDELTAAESAIRQSRREEILSVIEGEVGTFPPELSSFVDDQIARLKTHEMNEDVEEQFEQEIEQEIRLGYDPFADEQSN